MGALRRLYGDGPGHLAMMVVALGFAGYAVYAIFQNPGPWTILLWLALAIIVHDFVLLPAYTGVYRLLYRAGRVGRDKRGRIPMLHHLVAPAMVSILMLIVALPLVLGLSEANYRPTTAMTQEPYLERWLALTGGLFLLSGVVYALRRLRARRRGD